MYCRMIGVQGNFTWPNVTIKKEGAIKSRSFFFIVMNLLVLIAFQLENFQRSI